MSEKIRVGVLFGGRSCEHEVSVASAKSVLAAIDRQKYEVAMIGITKEGHWLGAPDASKMLGAGVVEGEGLVPVEVDQGGGGVVDAQGKVDVVFPILHGPFGEDGTVQGLLELAGVPYVGAGVLAAAVGMDKQMMKRAFRAEGLPQLEYQVVLRQRWRQQPEMVRQELEAQLAYPVFVKPASLGSSVGVSRAVDGPSFKRAMDEAAAYDRKIIIEAEAADCREVECAVLGNEAPAASVLGEIVPGNEFYDYNAKYIDDNSQLIIPARLDAQTTEKVRQMALQAFGAVDGAGLARVDFFVGHKDNSIYINEINTLPGFTPISMYPKLWAASGIEYGALIDRLIQLALERHQERKNPREVL